MYMYVCMYVYTVIHVKLYRLSLFSDCPEFYQAFVPQNRRKVDDR